MSDDPSKQQHTVDAMARLVELSVERTQMSAERSRLSAERSYMNAERTLSVWVRTALAMMIFGIAVDRFDLMLDQWRHAAPPTSPVAHSLSTWYGVALVALGALMAMVTGIRFLAYASRYRREGWRIPYHHGPYLATIFALLTAVFGMVLLLLMVAFLR